MVDGCDAPCNADPQEDVHRVTSGHVAHARIGVLVLAGGHLARERVCNKVIRLDFSSLCIAFFSFLFISPSFYLLTSSSIQFIDFQRFPLIQTTQYGAWIVVFTLICREYRK